MVQLMSADINGSVYLMHSWQITKKLAYKINDCVNNGFQFYRKQIIFTVITLNTFPNFLVKYQNTEGTEKKRTKKKHNSSS